MLAHSAMAQTAELTPDCCLDSLYMYIDIDIYTVYTVFGIYIYGFTEILTVGLNTAQTTAVHHLCMYIYIYNRSQLNDASTQGTEHFSSSLTLSTLLF